MPIAMVPRIRATSLQNVKLTQRTCHSKRGKGLKFTGQQPPITLPELHHTCPGQGFTLLPITK